MSAVNIMMPGIRDPGSGIRGPGAIAKFLGNVSDSSV